MRIILSGAFNPQFEALPEYVAAALRRMAHQVILFDHRAFLCPGRLRVRLPVLDRFDRDRLNARLLRLLRREHPDLLIVNQGMILTRRTIEQARSSGVRCVNWFSDYPAEFDEGLAAAPAYDAFFLGSSFAARRHRDAGHRHAAWLPFGCDPQAHRPEPQETGLRGHAPFSDTSPDAPPVVFIGSHYPERQVLLRFLSGLPVGVWGPGWERAADDPKVAPMIRGGALRPAAWRRLYARCLVALNIHYGSFGPVEVSGDLANTRVYEILACGAYQVVDRQGDVCRLFKEGEHLAAFSSGEELRARVEEALQDDGLRSVVAGRGRAEVLARHTYEHRARRLVDPQAAAFDTGIPERRPVDRVSSLEISDERARAFPRRGPR
jgi:spore maturation protein CgeB